MENWKIAFLFAIMVLTSVGGATYVASGSALAAGVAIASFCLFLIWLALVFTEMKK